MTFAKNVKVRGVNLASSFIVVAILAVVAGLAVASLYRKRIQAASKASQLRNLNPYLDLRKLFLTTSREAVGISVPVNANEPWAVAMDWNSGDWIATIAAASDGTASVYLSNGGGFIGGQRVPVINAAAKNCVQKAATAMPHMLPTEEFPLPAPGEVNLYVLTDSGVRLGKGTATEFASGQSKFAELANSAQEILTQFRLNDQKAK
jgi:Tfp pilus assembly protein FimT